MKKIIKISLLVGAFSISALALAQSNNPGPTPTLYGNSESPGQNGTASSTAAKARVLEMKENAERVRTEVRNKAATTAIQIRERLMTNSVEKIMMAVRNQAMVMAARFAAAVDRLDKIAAKIESRIVLLEETGRDVVSAKEDLALARGKINEANQAVVNLKTIFDEALSSEDPKSYAAQLKEASALAKEKIKEAHAALVDCINTLKPGTREMIQNQIQVQTQE